MKAASQQTVMPFYECAEDATNSAILRSGKTFKQVAAIVRPEISQDSAYAWLKNAIRDDTREKLSADQHILIANFCGEYDYLYYTASKCHHSRPEPVAPEDELREHETRFINAVTELSRMSATIAKLRGTS